MHNELKIALLPLDNRPVSYLLPKQIADFSGIDLLLPERKYLSNLENPTNLDYIDSWIKDLKNNSSLVIALDNWVYGGLVQSRRHSFSLETLNERINKLEKLSGYSLYAFSSIMRIANYNNNEEEKLYWKDYGEKLFKWSELTYRVGKSKTLENENFEELIDNWYKISKEIPAEIIADYKATRDKNFHVNLEWLKCLHKNLFNYLIFSCDDSGEYGLNIAEAEYLKNEISNHNFSKLAKVISGTDEISLILITKEAIRQCGFKPSVSVYFSNGYGKNLKARYESNSIFMSLINQLELFDLSINNPENSDINLFIHTSPSTQGDHVFNIKPEDTKESVKKLISKIEDENKPFVLIDLAYANGADPILINALTNSKVNLDLLYGFSAWNTCSNSIGSAISIGVMRWISEKRNTFKKEDFKKCIFTRLLDDFAYQAEIRHSGINEEELNKKLKPYTKVFSEKFGFNGISVECKLPWKRSFEVELILKH